MLSRLKLFAKRRSHHVPVAALTLSLLLLSAGGALAAPGGKGGKPTKPTVSIASPSSGSTASGPVTVSGSATGSSTALASVQVSVDSGAYQPASGTTSWNFPLDTASYSDGAHTIAAKATDSRGNTAVTTETVTFSNSSSTPPPPPPPPPPDTTPPSIAISGPTPSSTVSGTVSVSGSASDNVAVSTVQVSVDGGAYQTAQGTANWGYAWDTTAVDNGTHTLVAKATDTSGNTMTASLALTVSNSATAAPNTQGTWVSPEGVTINVDSAGSWTVAQVYSILKANALDLNVVGPTLTINVQDQYTNQTQTSATRYAGTYSNVKSTIWLQGVNSGFSIDPDDAIAHEYGHAWSNYWYYVAHQGDWSSYLNARWTTADGSLTLATDSRTGSSYTWQIREIIADDYRLLFGTSSAIGERPTHLNNQIPDPRNVPGLATFLLNNWRMP